MYNDVSCGTLIAQHLFESKRTRRNNKITDAASAGCCACLAILLLVLLTAVGLGVGLGLAFAFTLIGGSTFTTRCSPLAVLTARGVLHDAYCVYFVGMGLCPVVI